MPTDERHPAVFVAANPDSGHAPRTPMAAADGVAAAKGRDGPPVG